MRQLTVNTPSHSYPIFIGRHLIDQAAELLKPYLNHSAVIITNDTVAKLYLSPLQKQLDQLDILHFAIVLPDGEAHKDWRSLNQIFDGLMKQRAERKTSLLALGGGVIGDMVGFAAACYQRGVPFIQIPTTLLSQVDSSVGGKTAINHPLGKNMIGAFYQPEIVLADLSSLSTLPLREFSAGMAEVIKYGLLGDAEFISWLEEKMPLLMRQDENALAQAVEHSCRMKAEIVENDEKEHGIRAWLNLGHTFGHAIEAEMGYGVWLHGEAVAAGMVLACRLSEQLGQLSMADTDRVIRLLQQAGLPTEPPRFSFERWMTHMQHDKKVSSGVMQFITLEQLGRARMTSVNNPEWLRAVLSPYLD